MIIIIVVVVISRLKFLATIYHAYVRIVFCHRIECTHYAIRGMHRFSYFNIYNSNEKHTHCLCKGKLFFCPVSVCVCLHFFSCTYVWQQSHRTQTCFKYISYWIYEQFYVWRKFDILFFAYILFILFLLLIQFSICVSLSLSLLVVFFFHFILIPHLFLLFLHKVLCASVYTNIQILMLREMKNKNREQQ